MKKYNSYDLYRHNTMRLHCIGECVYIPESEGELIDIVKDLKETGKAFRIISGGSNIILPPSISDPIILMDEFNKDIIFFEKYVNVGGSVRVQKLIRALQEKQLGGIEYLFSIPCMVGGAIFMNAGRGRKYNKTISNNIVSVTVFNLLTLRKEEITHNDCGFAHRHSIFQNRNYIILSAKMSFLQSSKDDVEKSIQERLRISKKNLDAGKPSCGTIFCKANGYIMKLLKGFRIGGARWSEKTTNWISNDRQGSYSDVIRLLKMAKFLHKIAFQKYKQEVEVWK